MGVEGNVPPTCQPPGYPGDFCVLGIEGSANKASHAREDRTAERPEGSGLVCRWGWVSFSIAALRMTMRSCPIRGRPTYHHQARGFFLGRPPGTISR
jgi:hypothetical protein